MKTAAPAALVFGPYRVERLTLDGRAMLRVTIAGPAGRVVLADCGTATAALDVLAQHGVPVDKLVLEPDSWATPGRRATSADGGRGMSGTAGPARSG